MIIPHTLLQCSQYNDTLADISDPPYQNQLLVIIGNYLVVDVTSHPPRW